MGDVRNTEEASGKDHHIIPNLIVKKIMAVNILVLLNGSVQCLGTCVVTEGSPI